MKDDDGGEAGRDQSMWDFVEQDKDLGFYFECKGRSHWEVVCKTEHDPLFQKTHSSY